MHRVARKTPEIYEQDFATAPLDFYFDSARFKADEDSVRLESTMVFPLETSTT